MVKNILRKLASVIWNRKMFFWSARFLAKRTDTLLDDDGVELLEALVGGETAKAQDAIKRLAATLADMSKD